MIDLKLDRMYMEGALNTYIKDLSEWIEAKEAEIRKHQDKAHLAPVLESLQKHVDEVRSLLSTAENFRAGREEDKGSGRRG